MSPPKPKKAASRKPAKRAAKSGRGKAPRKAQRSSKPAKPSRKGTKAPRPKPGKPKAKPTASATGHAHCAATDPFGGTCQNLPRRPSKYCVIHSYLDR